MCKHKEFTFSYNNGIMIRKCKECQQVEIKIEDWVDIKELFTFLKKEVVNIKEVQNKEKKDPRDNGDLGYSFPWDRD